jgi:hypothetical protein
MRLTLSSRIGFDGLKEITCYVHVMDGFKELLSLLNIQGAIDVAQIHMQKSKVETFTTKYYSFNSKAYNVQLHAIIDYKKHFVDVFVINPKSMNDARILCLFSIYQITWRNFFHEFDSHEGIKPYIIGNKGYRLLSWLMVPHKQVNVQHSIFRGIVQQATFL